VDNSTFDNWYDNHLKEQQRLEAVARAKLRETAIPELTKKGVRQVIVDYSGYGDSGGIDGIIYKTGPGREETGEALQVSEECRSAVEGYADTLIPEGFEINDGAQGHLILNVESGSWVMHHDQNYTAVNSSTREGEF
jgi:hypothetical protein